MHARIMGNAVFENGPAQFKTSEIPRRASAIAVGDPSENVDLYVRFGSINHARTRLALAVP
jgi:hypothetical protein